MLSAILFLALGAGAVEWNWRAPAGCPSEASTRERFQQQAPASCALADDAEGPLQIDARVRTRGRGFDLELRLRRGERTIVRSVSGRSCAALADVAAVIAATACPELTPRASPVERPGHGELPLAVELPPERPTLPAPPEPPAPRPDRSPPATAPRPRPAAALTLRLGPAWGPTPAPALAVGGGVSLRWRRLLLLAALDFTTRRFVRAAEDPRVGVEVRLLGASLAIGPGGAWGRGRARGHGALLAAIEGGAMLGTGVGTLNVRTRAQPWAALSLGPRLGWRPTANFGASLQLAVAASLTRPAFRLEPYEAVVRGAAWSMRLLIGIEFALR